MHTLLNFAKFETPRIQNPKKSNFPNENGTMVI